MAALSLTRSASFSGSTAYQRLYSLKGQTVMAAPCFCFRPCRQWRRPASPSASAGNGGARRATSGLCLQWWPSTGHFRSLPAGAALLATSASTCSVPYPIPGLPWRPPDFTGSK